MAKVLFSRKEFEKHIKLTKEIEEKISEFGTHFESADSENIELEINPNRPDLFSLQTFIKSFSAFLGKNVGLRKYKVNKPEKNYEVKIDTNLKNIRPYTACSIIKNLKFDNEKIKEIIDIQEKIHSTLGRKRKKIAIGIYPLEKITLPIRFTGKFPKDIKFIPLEMSKEMNALQILQQHPTGREYAHLLEGKDKFPVFIDANDKILSIPPIINSHETGKITSNTKEIFIECSGNDLNILKKTLNILCVMFAEMGGEIYQMKVSDYITPDLSPEKIKIKSENIERILGIKLNEAEIKKLLEKMGYDYINNEVSIPAWRTDIMHEVDIIEDIGIAYGINNFVPEIPQISTIGEIDKKEHIKKKIAEILVGLNLLEISNYHLLTKEEANNAIEVEESKSDYKFLRPNLTSSMLKVLKENVDSEYPQNLFEIGVCFEKDSETETGINEKTSLCISLTPGNFTELKQILDYLSRMLNIKIELKEHKNDTFIEGRTGKIIINNKEAGIIGEVHPSVLRAYHIKMPSTLLELDLEEIFKTLSF